MAALTLPFFTVFWVAVATAVGLALLVLFFKLMRSSEADVEKTTKSTK
ncbi:MAG: hypothetical protein GOP50_05650 [Candidatus Heimdallarchaeota archaeon]|nr:hypothetical protein [Candidatus Heimdallarchaeota archaeon]